MAGLSIFIHAVRMVLGNLNPALRIGAGPVLVMVIAGWLLASNAVPSDGAVPQMPGAGAFGGGLLLVVVQVLASLWVAVAWHRYILLEEQPGAFLPVWNGGAIWSYFKAGLIVGLVVFALAIPLMVVAIMVLMPGTMANDQPPGLFAGLVMFLVVGIPATWLGYRLGPKLAGAAIGEGLTLGEAWRATARGAADLLGLAAVSAVALWLPLMLVEQMPGILRLLLSAVLNWASVMVGVGIITTIYGHYVQGRSLNA